MTSKQTPNAAQQTADPQTKPLARAAKVAAVAFAILYMVNGTGAAAGYAKALRSDGESSTNVIAQTVWVAVTWPVVLHDMMRAEPLERVETRVDVDA